MFNDNLSLCNSCGDCNTNQITYSCDKCDSNYCYLCVSLNSMNGNKVHPVCNANDFNKQRMLDDIKECQFLIICDTCGINHIDKWAFTCKKCDNNYCSTCTELDNHSNDICSYCQKNDSQNNFNEDQKC
jgi:hypothetical protein